MKARKIRPTDPSTWLSEEQQARLRACQIAEKEKRRAKEDEKRVEQELARKRAEQERERQLVEEAARQIREAEERERLHRVELARYENRDRAIAELRQLFLEDFLGTHMGVISEVLGDIPLTEGIAERSRFVLHWAKSGLSHPPDFAQVNAIASVHEHTLVAARAGSGKTRTIVNRAAFLVKHCGVDPGQIILLAFNKKAAEEMQHRLKALDVRCPHVMTFHALAHRIVHPEENMATDEVDGEGHSRSKFLQRVVLDYLKDPRLQEQIQLIMTRHFRSDWDRLITTGLGLSREEGLLMRRSLERETLDGTRVKSFGEKVIANCLFEHGVPYGYEWNHWWGGRNYRPDFTLRDPKIVIEYFGMLGDPDYDRKAEEKRRYWAGRKDWRFLEYGRHHISDSNGVSLQEALVRDLKRLGLPIRRLAEEEIWRKVQSRYRSRFAEILTGIVGRCRKALLDPSEFDERVRKHDFVSEVERDVLSIAGNVYHGYLDRLAAEGYEDFDGLLQRAIEEVDSGNLTFEGRDGAGDLGEMRFVMIDEYQDFAPLFQSLLHAIKARGRHDLQIFCVGDDWQAINAFAGSDLKFFERFEDYWEPSTKLHLTTNYRSSSAVIDVGNRIMAKHGVPVSPRQSAEPGEVLIADLALFQPSLPEQHYWSGDTVTPGVRRLIQQPLNDGMSVAILARQRYLPYQVCQRPPADRSSEDLERFGFLIRQGLSESQREQLHVGTVHAFKGREADVVIVLDAVERRFPKLHPDWVFGRIFGDHPTKLIEDERRLFYVACSRAKSKLILLTEGYRMSPFVEDINSVCNKTRWDDFIPFCPSDGEWILCLGNGDGYGAEPTKARVEIFKERDYQWSVGQWPSWSKAIPRKHELDEIVRGFPRAPWFDGPDGLEVRVCSSDGTVLSRSLIKGGEVHELSLDIRTADHIDMRIIAETAEIDEDDVPL